MCRSLNPQHQKRQKDSRSPKPVGIYVAPGRAKRLGLRLSFCRSCLEGVQRPTVSITPFLDQPNVPQAESESLFTEQGTTKKLKLAARGVSGHVAAMERTAAIQAIRDKTNQIASIITGIHPLVPKLTDPATQGELLKALFELTKQVEVVKKHLLNLEKGDDSALL